MKRQRSETEIDLHIENLQNNSSQLSIPDILHIQLDYCQKFLEQSIVKGFDKIVIIHGVGKGTLKKEIAKILKAHPNVASFHNALVIDYGLGATEVFLK